MAMADVGALIERAERCVDTFELPLALKFYERALAFEPDNCALLDATGELLLRLGEAERAVAVLEKSVSLAPNANFAAYLNLGQLQSGTAAVQRFEQGVELLRARERALRKRAAKVKAMAGVEARDELSVVQQQICSALCAIAEVYLTDLCDAADAEAACERAVEQALAAGAPERAPLPEALQTCANLRISQCRPADAASSLLKVVEHIAAAVDGGELEALPSHEFRTTTAKLLLEVGEVEPACDVLEQLLLEDEDEPELRYLAAVAAARARDGESAAGHVEWFQRQLSKPSCDEAMLAWSGSFEQVQRMLDELEREGDGAPVADAGMDLS
ncbi:hypothetical protein KFE25_006245 [Diacronema lutheri]|uniref:Uncharacterized protein n=1 Tax=Diacronema lutheri TaxID=2081491 RepID=A0A8J6CH39_DIALT|nr:hypothetical protein KFE25_006245 [Diacronema lutheri]